ncbi:MAG: nucleotidyl transferase, partial [Dehalococcoidia bacterium]|nr:nucleotidyl transferase [Dehalococcoidia bacterium]
RAAMARFAASGALALMTVYKNNDLYDRSNTAVDGGLVTRYSKRERTEDMVYIDYGVNLFKKAVLDMVPQDEPCSLEDLHQRLIERRQLAALEIKERFFEIGSLQGLKEFEEHMRRAE